MENPDKPEPAIRQATSQDAAALADCMRAAYTPYQFRMGNQPLPPLQADYAREIEDYPVWIAELGGQLAGGLIMAFNDDAASINNIAVHPQAQGHGLGRLLLNFAEQEAKSRGFTALELATHILLTENVSLYQHLGWKITTKDATRVYLAKEL